MEGTQFSNSQPLSKTPGHHNIPTDNIGLYLALAPGNHTTPRMWYSGKQNFWNNGETMPHSLGKLLKHLLTLQPLLF